MEDEKIIIKEFQLELVELSEMEAEAAVTTNSQFNYLKFILTDNKPNANKQRVPTEEFPNLVKTGYFAPLKMALGTIGDGHAQAVPLGVITHLKQTENDIRGIAALWTKERPEDVALIKKAYAEKIPLNVSWEISYIDSLMDDEGIENLSGTSLRAATIVGMPAYQGRTPIFAVASDNKEDKTLDELETLKTQLQEAQDNLIKAEAKTVELDNKVKEIEVLLPELDILREYKASIEKVQAEEAKLDAIKARFKEVGIAKEDEYFASNRENLINMPTEALDFMLQELVAFSSKKEEKAEKKITIPNLEGDDDIDLSDPKEIAKALRELNSRK